MTRRPAQVLVVPFWPDPRSGDLRVAVLKRADLDVWQFVAGGVESDESLRQAAIRELHEEMPDTRLTEISALQSVASIPNRWFRDADATWPLVVTEHAFAAQVLPQDITEHSDEHTQVVWVGYDEAMKLLEWDSNKTALWELSQRIRMEDLGT